MDKMILPDSDENGIIRAVSVELSEENKQRLKKFGSFMFFYDFVQEHFIRPRIHRANSKRHGDIQKRVISPINNSRILDIGCGTGAAIAFFDSTNEYCGLDLSYAMLKQAIQKAKKKSFRKCWFIQANAEKLFFESESFDMVLMDTALHMIPQYQLAIAEIARVLTPKGVFFCSTPVVGINEQFDGKWEKIAAHHSLHSLTIDAIQTVCSSNGLEYTQCDTNGGVLYFQAYKKRVFQ